jgi:4-hydroxybenzoate polyprenyltransferase
VIAPLPGTDARVEAPLSGLQLAGRLWRMARPGGMVLVLGLPATGYGFAHWEWAAPDAFPGLLLLLLVSWWFLSAGTLWLNAALDRDEGEVLMGPRPETVPHLEAYALGALGLAVVTALPLGPVPLGCAAVSALLAVAYSHPRFVWKGHPVLGPLVNVLGYGVLSPLAGWSLAGLPLTPRTVATLLLVAIWVAGTYFGAQAFQEEEDRSRGYRTLVAVRGAAEVVELTRALFTVTFVGLVALTLVGWYPRLLLVPGLAWFWFDAHLAHWILHPEEGVRAARTMLRRATVLACAVLFAAAVAHVDAMVHRRVPAGRDTAVRFGPERVRHYGERVGPRPPWVAE